MQALILAAGIGSRLGLGMPKCLVEVGGRPILHHQLDAIEQAGAHRITLVLGYEHEQVEDAAGGRAEVVLNERYAETNSLYSLWLARSTVEGAVGGAVGGDLLVLNSDVLFAPELLRDLLAVGGSAIAFDSSSGDEDEHMKVRKRQGRLARIGKDLPPMYSHGESIGMAYLSPLAVRAGFAAAESLIGRGRENDWAAAALNEVVGCHRVSCMDVAGQPWVEIDFPEDLDRARNLIWPAIAALEARRYSGGRRWSTSVEPDEVKEVGT
jgi:choline kinase